MAQDKMGFEEMPPEEGAYVEEEQHLVEDAVTYLTDVGQQDGRKPKVKDPPVTREAMAAFLEHYVDKQESCATIPYTMVLWVVFVTMSWLHGEATFVSRIRYCLDQSLEETAITLSSPDHEVTRQLKLHDVETVDEMWEWLEKRMVPTMSGSPSRPGFVCSFNQVVGDVMLRQHRVQATQCVIPEELQAYYGQDCYSLAGGADTSTETYGLGTVAARDGAWVAGSWLEGLAGDYRERFYAWLDCRRQPGGNPPTAEATVRDYWRDMWVDDQTVSLQAKATLFNAEEPRYGGSGAFIHVSVNFIFERGGVAKTKLEVYPLVVSKLGGVYVLDGIWFAIMLILFLNSLQGNKSPSGESLSFAQRCGPWVILDAVIVAAGIFLSTFWIMYQMGLGDLGVALGDLGVRPEVPDAGEGVQAVNLAESELNAYHTRVAQLTADIERLATLKICHRVSQFWYALLLLLRFCRGFAGQPRLAVFGRTMYMAASDLVHVALILVVVYLNFVLGGCILFGDQLSEWAGLGVAMRSAIDAFFGGGDFAAMYEVSPTAASTWLLFFVGTYSFVVMNVIIAILSEHYNVATDANIGMTLPRQIVEIISDKAWTAAYIMRILYRLLRGRLPTKALKYFREIPDEPERVAKIPWEAMIEELRDPKAPAWAGAGPKSLMRAGCDEPTACRLYDKALVYVQGYTPSTYPPKKLTKEFEVGMNSAYDRVDEFENEIREYLNDRLVEVHNLEPRQQKLEAVQKSIEFAPEENVLEHSAAYPMLQNGSYYSAPALPDMPMLQY